MKKGLLLVNLGTPDSPAVRDVWRYLIEFLTDERVIDLPWWKRQLLVRGAIVPLRVRSSAAFYKTLWTEEGSPLLTHTQKLTHKVRELLGEGWSVEMAMRYQNPSIGLALKRLKGCSEITVLPLFPQYASATTGSVIEKVMEEMKGWQILPHLRFIDSFYNHPKVIKAYAAQSGKYDLSQYDKVLFSFHGLPLSHLTKASPVCKKEKDCCKFNFCCYSAQCLATAELLAKELDLKPEQWTLSFQSRLGKDPWIEPYTSDVLKTLSSEGAKRVLVFCPAFVADCLETLHEIGVEYAHEFTQMGGEKLDLVPSLNDSDLWVEAVHDLVASK